MFKNSNLYHFYGEDIKRYYECRFEETIRQYACIEFLKQKICPDNEDILRSARKRRKYFRSLFGKRGIQRKFSNIPYTGEVIEEMWGLYYKKYRKKGWKPEKCGSEVANDFKKIFDRKTNRIWQRWEDELPGSCLIEVYNGNTRSSEVLKHFQSPLEPLVLITSRVGEEGIDLQAFTKGIIHYDFDWSPGKMVQREGRVDRIGRAIELMGKFKVFRKKNLKRHLKKEDMQVHYILLPHTYDERKYYRMKERQYLFNLLVPTDLENKAFHLAGNKIVDNKLSFKLGVKRQKDLL
jgi:hypothetical protein